MKVCFVGTTAFGVVIYPDDALMADILISHGIDVDYIPWDMPGETWDRHDAYINRCTWRYQDKYNEFERWLMMMDAGGKPFFNPASLQLWNTNKTYLRDLAAKGVPTVPGLFSSKADLSDIRAPLDATGWRDVVCKPSIGAGGFHVERLSVDALDGQTAVFSALLEQHPRQHLVIQPYIEEVARDGEWSFVFFDGAFSHALLKTPATGEFRVQSRLGGSTRLASPTESQTAQAQKALRLALDTPPLYARIDGYFVKEQFLLAEFEVCEPYLWLGENPGAAEMFAGALLRRLAKK